MNSIEHDYENNIIKDNEYEFNDTIIKRGKNYYENGMVLSVIKSNNRYVAKVVGSVDEPYTVNVEYDEEDDYYDYDCTCPCEYPCKHIYAVLMSINDVKTAFILCYDYFIDNRNGTRRTAAWSLLWARVSPAGWYTGKRKPMGSKLPPKI